MCFELICKKDLKHVMLNKINIYKDNDNIEFQLIKRKKDTQFCYINK